MIFLLLSQQKLAMNIYSQNLLNPINPRPYTVTNSRVNSDLFAITSGVSPSAMLKFRKKKKRI